MELIEISNLLQSQSHFPCVLATLVNIEGSSYRRKGARMLIKPGHFRSGSISGGCLEEDLIARANRLLAKEENFDLVVYDTTSENDLTWGVGTGCHGIVRIFLERLTAPPEWSHVIHALAHRRTTVPLTTIWKSSPESLSLGTHLTSSLTQSPVASIQAFSTTVLPPWHLVIIGAGDDAQPLANLAHTLRWQVTVLDPRPHQATPERFPRAERVESLPAEQVALAVEWDDRTVAVAMTHHYRFDLPVLKTLLPLNLPFFGLLGPKARGERLLRDAGFDSSHRHTATFHNPVGLDLGGDGPEAVALSILAEIHARVNERDARPLRDRNRSIHDDS
jgi:xanthine/CO dehydrogenase XdhC/CoxF family maturation factor